MDGRKCRIGIGIYGPEPNIPDWGERIGSEITHDKFKFDAIICKGNVFLGNLRSGPRGLQALKSSERYPAVVKFASRIGRIRTPYFKYLCMSSLPSIVCMLAGPIF